MLLIILQKKFPPWYDQSSKIYPSKIMYLLNPKSVLFSNSNLVLENLKFMTWDIKIQESL